MNTVLSFGASILGALFGRKLASTTNVTRATSAMKGVGRSFQQRDDISRAEDSVEALADSEPDYGDLAGDMPRISDLDIKADTGSRHPLKH